jgi:hypothetical protein
MTMQWRGFVSTLVATFLIGVWHGAVYAAGDVFERISLKGLKSVQVVVEDFAPDLIKDGLNRERIKSTVEQQLTQAGILVEPQAENALYIHLGSVKNETGVYSYALSLQLVQLVLLFRDPSLLTWGTTWSLDLVGSVAGASVSDLEPLIGRGVNSFVADYQAANQLS